MTNQSIEKFREYLENQNDDFIGDGRRIEGIIRDIFPDEKPLISLLTTAWKAGVVAELRQSNNIDVTIAQFGDRLSQEYGFKESSALVAVRVWAYALGFTDVVPNINVSSTPSFRSQPSITPETKNCPFCAEEVKKDARKCKHCQSDISDENTQLNSGANPDLSSARECGRDGRFIAYDNGTVLDTSTNLMWAARDNGANIDWANAKSYCENYRGGYSDWRMPAEDELAGLYDSNKTYRLPPRKSYNHDIDVHLTELIQLSSSYCFSSNTHASDVMIFYFDTGEPYWGDPFNDFGGRALPVRQHGTLPPSNKPPLSDIHKAAEQGDANAQYELGNMYLHGGEVVLQSDSKAAKWYHKSAAQGNADAQLGLWWMYLNGYGVPQDYADAVKWCRRSAEQGNAEAQYHLGEMYRDGQGVPESEIEAAIWFRKAAEQGDERAQSYLHNAESVKLYRKYAEQGDVVAQVKLGIIYQRGKGVRRNDAEAGRWFFRAAEQGHADAQFNLCQMYLNGEGVPTDDAEAVKWCRKSAEQGHIDALSQMGRMYHDGRGVSQSESEAEMWFRRKREQIQIDARTCKIHNGDVSDENTQLNSGANLDRSSTREWCRDGRFIAYDNDTVLDTSTNLMWAARDNGGGLSWQDAKKYCDNYRAGGYTDWRLPTQDELGGLYESGNYENIIAVDDKVWASETNGASAASIWFSQGMYNWFPQSNDYINRVLPVRSGK